MKNFIKAIILTTCLTGAMRAQTVNYSYVKNDPFDMRNFTAGIDPMFIDVNSHNGYAFGWGLRGEYMMGKSFMFNTDFRFGFGTQYYKKSNSNTANYFVWDAGGGIILMNKAHMPGKAALSAKPILNTRIMCLYCKGHITTGSNWRKKPGQLFILKPVYYIMVPPVMKR